MVLSEEKCCGYDSYWSGDDQTYNKLAKHNIEVLRKKKVGQIVTSCPECYVALKSLYPNLDPSFKPEVLHISQLLAKELEEGRLTFRGLNGRVTYHDPCRLGRVGKEYDAPRAILRAIPGLEFVEMTRNRENSPCCGVGNYSNCDSHTKFLQNERLKEAALTGAQVLSTACPKCRIHFDCYLDGNPIEEFAGPQIKDLTGIILEAMKG
jgi:Fe-S oxidoreductase